MRFAELHLIRYGRFDDCRLVFPRGDHDLQLIVGPNEAGKSTTLEAVSDLLFGFEPRTKFAFRFPQPQLRVGALIEAPDGPLEVRRRKGNVDTLLNFADQPVDGARLTAALAGQTRESFKRMFGLDHARLRAGGQAILAATDDVGAAIFSAGAGLMSVSKLCEALDAEARQIWSNRGESARYKVAATAYRAAQAQLKEAGIRPAAWEKARRALEAAEGELSNLRELRAKLAQDRRDVQRRQRVLPAATRRAAAQARLAQLSGAPVLSEAAVQQCDAALGEAEKARTEIELATTDIRRLEAELANTTVDGMRLAVAAELDTLTQLKGVADKGTAEKPLLQAERESSWSRITAATAELGWPSETPEAIKGRTPGKAATSELRDLLERRRALDEQGRSAAEAVGEASELAGRLEAQLKARPTGPDLLPLQKLVRELRDAGYSQARLKLEKTCEDLVQVLTVRLRALAPWRGDLAALRNLPLPADGDVDHALDQLEACRARVASETETFERATARLQQLQLEQRQTGLAHPIPNREELDARRRTRREAWTPIRAQLLGEASFDDARGAIAAYEATVLEADKVADERFAAAEQAAGLARLEREIEQVELEVAQTSARVAAAAAAEQDAAARFARLVDPIGAPLSPYAYSDWRDARDSVLEAADALDAARLDLQRAQGAEDGARDALLGALALPRQASTSPLATLLAQAEQQVDAAAEEYAATRELQGKLDTARDALARAEHLHRAAAVAEAEWDRSWRAALGRAGLPPETGPVAARTFLDVLEDLVAQLETSLECDSRLAAVEEVISDFESRVRTAAGALGLDLNLAPSRLFGDLQLLAAEANASVERARTLQATLDRAQTRLGAAQASLGAAEAALSALRASAPEAEMGELRELLREAAEVARLRTQLADLEAEILGHGEGRDLSALLAEVSAAEPSDLATEADRLDEAVEDLNMQIEAKTEARQAAEGSFSAIDDRPDAAIAAFEAAEARAEMAFQAELYIQKRAQARLLRAAVERYRQEKQGPLLTRASAVFATLTLGAFSELFIDYVDDKPRLAGLRANGDTVIVEGMSDGTVDQLYLALRIAAVEDAVASGVRLPFVADDLFINFDDARSAAGFKVLAELSKRTQVLFFTHHDHLADVAKAALAPVVVSACGLERDAPPVLTRSTALPPAAAAQEPAETNAAP